MQGRRSSTFTRLLRHGFTDPAAAERLLDVPELSAVRADPVLLEALGATADPDQALLGLVRLVEALDPDERRALLDTVTTAKPLRDRLLGVLGASEALGDHLARHPGDWHALVTYEAADLHPGVAEFERGLAAATDPDALRAAYRRCLLGIAARDVCGTSDLVHTAAELADLATATLRAALAIAAAEAPHDAAAARLAVIGMGKCGGHELNYVSDVDVIFVAEPSEAVEEVEAVRAATRLAARMMRVCSDTTAEGTIWPVDANLRPEGKNGPLVRTLSSHLAYYARWAKTWEFQALLKARPVAGDPALGAEYVAAIRPLVWQAAEREHFVTDVQQMRRRVVDNIPAAQVERELKLGPGGLRDVEFAVQLLQLVHGRTDSSLRSGTTLTALAELAAGGYVGRADAASLDDAYRFLRLMEHRIQLHKMRRTHLVPADEAGLRRLGRGLGFRSEPVANLTREWKRHGMEVRRLHEKLFYRPLLESVAQLGTDDTRLSTDAARQRLQALGYADPAGAIRHLEALASGVSRKAAIQRTLLPVLLGWFADSADPDAGLLGFRKVSDALGLTPWYLRLLRDEGAAAQRLARVLSSGRMAPDLLLRAPEAVAVLGSVDGGLVPRDHAVLEQEVLAAVGRAEGPEQAIAAVRGVRRRELFRTAAADLIDTYGDDVEADEDRVDAADLVDRVGCAVFGLTAATLAGALRAAVNAVTGNDARPLPTRFAVIGMGRFGGRELGYGSDADVLFVHEPRDGVDQEEAGRAALAVADEMRRLLQIPTADPPLLVDADLRPEGKSGPLVRSLASYAAYYRRWSLVWESQALLRAMPVAGDQDLGTRFMELIDPLRYPAGGLDEEAVREIRRLKARMESERLPRGADRTTHAKLGRGGLSDVEWTVQLLQLQHAGRLPELRTTGTRQALAAAVGADLIDPADAAVLDEAWVLATRVRNAVMLVRGRPGDTFPGDGRELAAVGRYLGFPPGHVGDMLEDYRRRTRRARAVVDRLFYQG
ncbi:bifunctional [glutamine synthetase] adenylyltransferase/[glutamine synthetase]-adenylyl-L-tyrosine phosphorylase [Streptomyces cocklensis]|uniref:Bifunctional glutamine synthetase adenylyltransferase/adenylyl-removing enzyme n=1 Tax=Actinacidiphila cocklensis TaxID=887465 RepID=A0A9W4DPX2_9ACTN|nr:bifunctional [glutamine synthetase] adenylyltransferase/[glutamine synthetase]-adenylyl-L-tyrosine phosphorylase [Actinacidiphila cocklensis]MDD1062276.1 bifunctional [glutamine synthetase] adenylyltransferase/[glutamine synthetase]-adenylyl-L-tyrosine phosphorylase [Actinacidiphila cocklensis]CAG6395470.1 Glutamine synthetase adenylyl-L-tyrosine phosphorylase / Glutamine synthetase adenylyl transferase [Actinacidiphila cocklensis]